ncbi:MAG: hypothetical protein EKK48_00610 [Candidatus Melainabacteria bacterium]|nr:MAG: hypothetical protein EKK48_00610 [Candidatus Melainabacteria bacterium]
MDKLKEIAARHGFSVEAVRVVLDSLRSGGGTMAQFNHPELGGMGQWSTGMLMIGDMSNSALKARVRTLCDELSRFVALEPTNSLNRFKGTVRFPDGETVVPFDNQSMRPFDSTVWWPELFGVPSSSGAQNRVRYAYFPATSRLAIERSGRVTVYDTGKHKIYGVSQSQGTSDSLVFESQLGPVSENELTKVRD